VATGRWQFQSSSANHSTSDQKKRREEFHASANQIHVDEPSRCGAPAIAGPLQDHLADHRRCGTQATGREVGSRPTEQFPSGAQAGAEPHQRAQPSGPCFSAPHIFPLFSSQVGARSNFPNSPPSRVSQKRFHNPDRSGMLLILFPTPSHNYQVPYLRYFCKERSKQPLASRGLLCVYST
jgi:hypothetical protein